ncbi:DDE-type integrase/transposase/recombinase [Ixodes scapularis]
MKSGERFSPGVLYKENFSDNSKAWLLVVPSSLQGEIFQACHDDPTAGHLGYSRTLARIREKYYWPKLAKTVHHYTRSCHECQRRKKPPTKPAGLLQPIAPPSAPFQQIGMDLLGPFPTSTQGNRWIIVATDYLTRCAETKALPSGTAVEVAKFFIESIVLRHGAPEVLISDRGSSFMAQLTQEVLRLSHTSHCRTTAYHPQTNGLTERLNKTIADMISMYVDVEHKTWDEVLPYVTFAYNTAVQETTGVTPFQLVHGRKVTTILDAMLPHEPAVDASDDAQVVTQRAEEVRQLARLRIKAQQRVDTGRYNLRRRDLMHTASFQEFVHLARRVYGAAVVLQEVDAIRKWPVQDGQQSLFDHVAAGRGVETPIDPCKGSKSILADGAPDKRSTAATRQHTLCVLRQLMHTASFQEFVHLARRVYGAAVVLQEVDAIRKWPVQDGQQSLFDHVAAGRGVETPIDPCKGSKSILADGAPDKRSTAATRQHTLCVLRQGAPVKAGVWRVASPRTPSPAGGACTLGARCLVSSVTTDPSHVGHHTRTQGAPTLVVQRGHAPLKVAVATQTSFLDYRKPQQSPTPKLKIQLPGRAVTAGGSTASSSQTTTPPALTGQQSVPVSGEGAQTASPSQDGSATAKPGRSPRSPSRERGPRPQERKSTSKERHGSCATPTPKGQEEEVSGTSLPGTSTASLAGGGRGRRLAPRSQSLSTPSGKVSPQESESMDENTQASSHASDTEDMEWQAPKARHKSKKQIIPPK